MDLSTFTPLTWIGAALALVLALGIIAIGLWYLLAPATASAGFGFTTAITPEVTPWQHIKGPRDIASGLVVIAMLVGFGPTAAAVILLVESIVPIGDMANILRHRGNRSAAFGVHGATAAAMILAAVLLFF
ncbi:protein of unknown function [Agromyces sp. CF514]|uniref:DUF4267 domain-containing protein n=1 Tax=Agromyces sp. CF514 TaxID=1881031 RepID=UPI0008E5FAE9|nr:DUF4267 domain-containing protein [Agromyces sp. CF514]SFR66803.1 protein of unknown function [Agromyces sp. CF514]